MFIGTSWRKTFRMGRNISGYLQPIKMDPGSSPGVTEEEGNMDPGSVIPDLIRDRGDGLLKEPGFFRPHSVIPAEAEPAPDSIRGIHVHRNETAEEFPEGCEMSLWSRAKITVVYSSYVLCFEHV
jgi:hypothetical protein